MKTAIVILNWNTAGYLDKFLPGLLKSTENIEGAEVIVADNGSADGSTELMREKFPHVKLIEFDSNHGFTGGYNRAFEIIAAENNPDAPEYFLLINSDVEVNEDWLGPLVRWMDGHPECGACGPKIRSWKDKDMFEYAGAAGGYLDSFGYPFCRGRVMGNIEKDCGQYDNLYPEVFWMSGACLMVRTSAFRQAGGLDGRFFAHMEEIDLCWRLQLAGYTICVVPESVVFHVGGGTLPSSSPFKLFLNFRNNLLMMDNNLAKTFALKHHKDGLSAEEAAAEGMKEAEEIIRTRMLMDGLSASVYLLTFRFKAFRSVLKAHKEFKTMRREQDMAGMITFLKNGGNAEVKGVYGKWIVPIAVLMGKRIFPYFHKTDFYKF